MIPVSQSDSAGGETTGFRAEQTSQQPSVASVQSRTASTPAELQHAHGADEEQNSSTHSNGNSQVDGRPEAHDYLKHLSGIWRGVLAYIDSLEHGEYVRGPATDLRLQLECFDNVYKKHQLRLGPGWELCSLLHSYMEDTLHAAVETAQKGDFGANLTKTKMYHAKILAYVEDYLEAETPAEQLHKREALIEHIMPGALVGLKDCKFSLDAPVVRSAKFCIPGVLCADPTPTKRMHSKFITSYMFIQRLMPHVCKHPIAEHGTCLSAYL